MFNYWSIDLAEIGLGIIAVFSNNVRLMTLYIFDKITIQNNSVWTIFIFYYCIWKSLCCLLPTYYMQFSSGYVHFTMNSFHILLIWNFFLPILFSTLVYHGWKLFMCICQRGIIRRWFLVKQFGIWPYWKEQT